MASNPNKCYLYAYEVYMTAGQAALKSASLGYSLLSIDSKEENDELIDIIINCKGPACGSAWIGLNYDNTSSTNSWIDGYPLSFTSINESSSYCNDGFEGKQYFLSWDGLWYNCPAKSYYGRVHGALYEYRTDCPKGWLQSTVDSTKCINTQTNKQSFFDASTETCGALSSNANVAQVFSADANHELLVTATAEAMKCDKFFIDLVYQNNQWQWFGGNGQNVTYFNWKQGYPANLTANPCVMLNIDDGTWTNEDCMQSGCFICEKSLAQIAN
uniref:C-type lectin domain-containing protein n=1 Tax=Acrobeloides nanus TaxID=290746 RepID=A0A914EIT1_9BILA